VADVLFGATFVLSGLRYDRDRIVNIYRRLSMMLEDSTTYQWIMEQGEAKGETRARLAEARSLVLRLGTRRFGPPQVTAQAALAAVTDRERLERIAERIFEAANWDDLLATP
jgi:predicted transposase YdaD